MVEDGHVVCELVEDKDEVDAWVRFSEGDFGYCATASHVTTTATDLKVR